LALHYNKSALPEATTLGGIILQIADSILKNPGSSVKELEFVGPEHKTEILRWNNRPAKMGNISILDIFHERCLEQPHALAISSWEGDISYKDVDDLSSKLAFHLRTLGVGPDTMVPICFEKSSWAIVAILAILRAGGAYVPLDPSIPIQRLQNIIQQVKGSMILASSQQTPLFANMGTIVTISKEVIHGLPIYEKLFTNSISPDQTFYVLLN